MNFEAVDKLNCNKIFCINEENIKKFMINTLNSMKRLVCHLFTSFF